MKRRQFLGGLGAMGIGAMAGHSAVAQTPDLRSSRVRVIDSSDDVTAFVSELRAAGIIAVGRYYGRPAPAGGCLYPTKLLTARELRAIDSVDMSIVSVFQHCASNCDRFRESYRKGTEDASAAIHAAYLLGQPAGTPIYFGVDFNPVPTTDDERNEQCGMRSDAGLWSTITDYFRQVNEIMRKTDWKVGVYGAGATCAYLKSQTLDGLPLADFFWLSASITHKGHAAFFKPANGPRTWNLFQNKVDIKAVPYLAAGLECDTDITNPERPYFGQWRPGRAPDTLPIVEAATARMILAHRAFMKPGFKVFQKRADRGDLIDPFPSTYEFKGRTVRIIEDFPAGTGRRAAIGVNLFEGETTNGYIYRDDLIVDLSNGMP